MIDWRTLRLLAGITPISSLSDEVIVISSAWTKVGLFWPPSHLPGPELWSQTWSRRLCREFSCPPLKNSVTCHITAHIISGYWPWKCACRKFQPKESNILKWYLNKHKYQTERGDTPNNILSIPTHRDWNSWHFQGKVSIKEFIFPFSWILNLNREFNIFSFKNPSWDNTFPCNRFFKFVFFSQDS